MVTDSLAVMSSVPADIPCTIITRSPAVIFSVSSTVKGPLVSIFFPVMFSVPLPMTSSSPIVMVYVPPTAIKSMVPVVEISMLV